MDLKTHKDCRTADCSMPRRVLLISQYATSSATYFAVCHVECYLSRYLCGCPWPIVSSLGLSVRPVSWLCSSEAVWPLLAAPYRNSGEREIWGCLFSSHKSWASHGSHFKNYNLYGLDIVGVVDRYHSGGTHLPSRHHMLQDHALKSNCLQNNTSLKRNSYVAWISGDKKG